MALYGLEPRSPRALTPEEERWRKRLERVLMDVPPGIGLAANGDAKLTVYDRASLDQDAATLKERGQSDDELLHLGAGRYSLGSARCRVCIDGVAW